MKDALKKPNKELLLTVMKGGIADRVPNYEILPEARNVKACSAEIWARLCAWREIQTKKREQE